MRNKKIEINGQDYSYQVSKNRDKVIVKLEGKEIEFSRSELDSITSFKRDNQAHTWFQNEYFEIKRKQLTASSSSDTAGSLKSPMPGKIFKVLSEIDKPVKAGETILILEAMKMEHAIKSPIDGIIKAIHFNEGDIVDGSVELAEVTDQ